MNIHIFKNFRKRNRFGIDIYNGTVTLNKVDKDQSDLLFEIWNFSKEKRTSKSREKNKRKKMFLKAYMQLFMVEKEFLMLLKARYYQ